MGRAALKCLSPSSWFAPLAINGSELARIYGGEKQKVLSANPEAWQVYEQFVLVAAQETA